MIKTARQTADAGKSSGGGSFCCVRSPLPRTSILALEEGLEVLVGEKEALG